MDCGLIGSSYYAIKLIKILLKNNFLVKYMLTNDGVDSTLVRYCMQNRIPVYNTNHILEENFKIKKSKWLFSINNDKIIPETIISRFAGNILNMHNGLMPEYGGRFVTQWMLLNGETLQGSIIHYVEPAIDCGDVDAIENFIIKPTDNGLSLYKKSFDAGLVAYERVIKQIASNKALERAPIDAKRARIYRSEEAKNLCVDWNWEYPKIERFFRAADYSPLKNPGFNNSFIVHDQKIFLQKIIKAPNVYWEGQVGSYIIETGQIFIKTRTCVVKVERMLHDGKIYRDCVVDTFINVVLDA